MLWCLGVQEVRGLCEGCLGLRLRVFWIVRLLGRKEMSLVGSAVCSQGLVCTRVFIYRLGEF